MNQSRRRFLQTSSLLAAALPLTKLRLSSAEPTAAVSPLVPPASPDAGARPLREILFTPGNTSERLRSYDRFEPMQKSALNPVFTATMPWEDSGFGWGSVIRSRLDGKFKYFYGTEFPGQVDGTIAIDNSQQGKKHCVVCYAESDDGLHWHRPALNLFFADKFPGNNIIVHWPAYFNDSSSVIEDFIERDSARRYKMLMYHHDVKNLDARGGCLLVSPDGLHWTPTGTVLPSQDAESLWQDPAGHYYGFLKDRIGDNRSRMLVHSADFKTWSEPQWIITPDHGDHAGTNFYNQSAFTLSGRTLGFLNVYDLETQTTWIELVESGDNFNWRRMPSRARLLEPGSPGSYDGGGTYLGLAEPILIGDEHRYYYYASADRHDDAAAGQLSRQKPSLAFATFKKNRLVGQQTEGDGYFATLPFICPGGKLFLNFVCASEVSVSVKRAGYGIEYEGLAQKDCHPVTGDQPHAAITWATKPNLDELKGHYIRLRIHGRNLTAYSAAFEA
ncbi:MAG: hypothetical protein ABI222_00610 [Opitutaceae bacterium]